MGQIVVIAEHDEGRVRPVTYELVSCALELKRIRPATIGVFILGDQVATAAEEIAARTGCQVTAVEVPGLTGYNGEAYREILVEQLREADAELVLVAHSSQGADFAPGLAIRLGAACLTSVLGVAEGKEGLCFSRALFNGKFVAQLSPETAVVVVTVAPGAFAPVPDTGAGPEKVLQVTARYTPKQIRYLGMEKPEAEDSSLTEAEVIVAVGRGIRKEENLALAYRLAALFPRSAVAGSRPLCDLGWLAYRQQVGVTGASVTPKLYIACGISGASQHISGMAGSGFVVAINTDPNAAIFNQADVCVIEDLTTFIPLLIEEHRKESAT